MYSSSPLMRSSAAVCREDNVFRSESYSTAYHLYSTAIVCSTHGDVGVRGLSALEVVLGEELGELRLDAAQRLSVPVKQQHHVHHGEALTHQGEQVTEEPCQDESVKCQCEVD